jgi:hypothetical protein
MKKTKYQVVQELDPESVDDIEQHKRDHYVSLGYKPYLLSDGTVKWLTETQMVYHRANSVHSPILPKLKSSSSNPSKRRRSKHRSNLHKFFLQHWVFIVVMVLLIIGMWFLWTNWNVIF